MAVTSSRRDVLHFGCATAVVVGASALAPAGSLAQEAPARNASAEDFFYREDWFGEPWRTPETAVLIHGNAESSIVWYAWMPRMGQEFRVLRPDLPGFGRSRIPSGFEWSLPSLATYVAHVLDKAGIDFRAHHRRQDRGHGCDAVCRRLPGAHPHAFGRERARFRSTDPRLCRPRANSAS